MLRIFGLFTFWMVCGAAALLVSFLEWLVNAGRVEFGHDIGDKMLVVAVAMLALDYMDRVSPKQAENPQAPDGH